MEVELRVQIYPDGLTVPLALMSTSSTFVFSMSCRSTDGRQDGAGVAVLGVSGPPPPSACNWPTAVCRAAISPFFSSKLQMSSSVRPSKATLEQKPSLPRALATALGSPHSDKNAPKSNRLAMLAVRYICCNFAGGAQSARFSPYLSLYPFSLPPHLNNWPLSALPSPARHYTSL